jgi:hypothetical protein
LVTFTFHDKHIASLTTLFEYDYDPNKASTLSNDQQSCYVSKSIEASSAIGSTFIPNNTLFTCQYFFKLHYKNKKEFVLANESKIQILLHSMGTYF